MIYQLEMSNYSTYTSTDTPLGSIGCAQSKQSNIIYTRRSHSPPCTVHMATGLIFPRISVGGQTLHCFDAGNCGSNRLEHHIG
jgi:hypothetical protein